MCIRDRYKGITYASFSQFPRSIEAHLLEQKGSYGTIEGDLQLGQSIFLLLKSFKGVIFLLILNSLTQTLRNINFILFSRVIYLRGTLISSKPAGPNP